LLSSPFIENGKVPFAGGEGARHGLHLFEEKRNYPADYNDAGSAQSGADLVISLRPGIAQRDRIAGLLLAR
jgi:hypothetical protein